MNIDEPNKRAVTSFSDIANELWVELEKWKLTEIYDVFTKECVTKEILWKFEEEDLKDLGIKLTQRKKYFHAVEKINDQKKLGGNSNVILIT